MDLESATSYSFPLKCFRETASVRQLHKRRLMSHRIGHGDGSGPDCQRPSSTSYNRKLTRKSIPTPTVLHPHATEIRALGKFHVWMLIDRKFTITLAHYQFYISYRFPEQWLEIGSLSLWESGNISHHSIHPKEISSRSR